LIDGLEPYWPRKNSCVPWLGQMPTHWELHRTGRLRFLAFREKRSRPLGEADHYCVVDMAFIAPMEPRPGKNNPPADQPPSRAPAVPGYERST
jgi:hypothetical protein